MRLTTALLAVSFLGAISALASADTKKESLSWGCSGGFTGGGSGIVVHRDGEIHRWSRPTYRDSTEYSFVRSDSSAADDLFAELERISFTSIHYSKPGNVTCSITLRRAEFTHTVTWPMSDPATPSEVLALASRMEQLAGLQPVEEQ